MQQLINVGNSKFLSVPAKVLRRRNISKEDRFEFEEREDGFFFRIVKKDDPEFPKVDIDSLPSEDIDFLLANPVVPDADDAENPLIKRLLDENFC